MRPNKSDTGFTLVELLVCILVLGILSAIALPTFLSTKDTAEASSTISSMTSFAKICGSKIIANDPAPVSGATAGIQISNSAICDGSTNIEITNSNRFNPVNIGGLRCGNDSANGTTHAICTLEIERLSGSINGSWSP